MQGGNMMDIMTRMMCIAKQTLQLKQSEKSLLNRRTHHERRKDHAGAERAEYAADE